MRRRDEVAKRAFDLVVAGIGLIVLSPVLAIAAATVRVRLGSPVLFTQARPGRGGEVFTIHKLRTMSNARDRDGQLLPDGERLGRVGRVLRATSIDELPELFDVLRGPMSIVGPRPLLVEYLDRYTPAQARRMEVKPGITGLAQVNGRNALTFEDRFELDVRYVDTWSLGLDIRIIGRTLRSVLRREGISGDGEATMQVWTGTTP